MKRHLKEKMMVDMLNKSSSIVQLRQLWNTSMVSHKCSRRFSICTIIAVIIQSKRWGEPVEKRKDVK
ncbi:hypothetical protein RchiOBHm_Chr7g0230121 [Rosa chinensis]|uniref:Uncharacterized protein n=1 Tax=Rosa chinensis TaxID=74649 RepID=A0A2P6PFD0_ROSCH|nr:hypothetical protein RchiOBHm_Chr7g0230121 [Rosa chinensis]